jgi:hypothetical protein
MKRSGKVGIWIIITGFSPGFGLARRRRGIAAPKKKKLFLDDVILEVNDEDLELMANKLIIHSTILNNGRAFNYL